MKTAARSTLRLLIGFLRSTGFAVLQNAFDEGAYEIRVTYDAQFGVPVDFWINYSQNIIDEELGFTVTEAVQPIS